MKKVFFLGLAVVGLTMVSCTKDYTCTYNNGSQEVTQDYNGLDKDEAEAAESGCSLIGGTWAQK